MKYVLLLVAIGISSGFLADQFAQAQEFELTPNVKLDTNQVIIVIIIGTVGGIVRAWQGYDKSPNDFDFVEFIRGVRQAVLISIPIALSSAIMMELNAYGYVVVFFAVIGGTQTLNTALRPSIPSNATEEEIEAILNRR